MTFASLAVTPPAPAPASYSTPIVAGVVSAVAGAALIALGVFLKRRRSSKQKTGSPPPVPPSYDGDNLEQGHDPSERASTSAAPAVGNLQNYHRCDSSSYSDTPGHAHGNDVSASLAVGPAQSITEHVRHATAAADGGVRKKSPSREDTASPHRRTPVRGDAVIVESIVPPSAPTAPPAEFIGAGLAGEEDATAATSFATVSTANMSTVEQEEVAQFRQRQLPADAVAIGPTKEGEALGASSSTSRRGSNGDIGLGQAVLAAAQELARSCQIPGVSEAAGVLCIMANLFTDSRDIDQASKSRLRQCRSIVLALTRADKVVAKVSQKLAELVVKIDKIPSNLGIRWYFLVLGGPSFPFTGEFPKLFQFF